MRLAATTISTHSFQVSGRAVIGVVDVLDYCSLHWFYVQCASFDDYVEHSRSLQSSIFKHPQSLTYAHPSCSIKQQVYFTLPVEVSCRRVEQYENTRTISNQKLYRMRVSVGPTHDLLDAVLGPFGQDAIKGLVVQLQTLGPQRISLPAFGLQSTPDTLCEALIDTLNPSRYQIL